MKLVSYTHNGETRIACQLDRRLVDLNHAYRAMLESQGKLRAAQIAEAYVPADIVGFLQGGDESMEAAKAAVDFALANEKALPRKTVFSLDEVKIEAPVQRPGKMICVGHNYREHILEMGREIPPYPLIFAKFSNTLLGPNEDIPLFASLSEQLDYEAELAFVIGKRARNVPRSEGLNYVAGYTVVNDITYRDLQRRTLQWLQGKTVDGTAPMGPWLITSDELKDPSGLDIQLTVNGEVRQRSNTQNFVFTVPYLVEYLSSLMTLEPGDIVLTGTPGGVGFAMNPPTFLKDGDVVRVEVQNVGAIENRIRLV